MKIWSNLFVTCMHLRSWKVEGQVPNAESVAFFDVKSLKDALLSDTLQCDPGEVLFASLHSRGTSLATEAKRS